MKKKYDLFYDESSHDRAITENKNAGGELNIENNGQSDNFITAIVGFKFYKTTKYIDKFVKFERDTKHLLGLDESSEFKGTTLAKKNFRYGIASFNKNTLKIYSDFFDLFDDNVFIQVSILNKFEHVIEYILKYVQLPRIIDPRLFMYSFSKVLNHYKNKKLISVLFNSSSTTKDIICEIETLFEDILSISEGSKRKASETNIIYEILSILESSRLELSTKRKYEWDYSKAIFGLTLLLQELRIDLENVDLFIDQEEKTFLAAESFPFRDVKQVDSKECQGVRIADILCSFMSRLLKSIEDEYREDWDVEETKLNIEELRILSEDWFRVNNEQFNLYKKVGNVFGSKKRRKIHYTVFSSVYPGNASVVFSLIYYIGKEYTTFADYQSVSLKKHRELFNVFSVSREYEQY